MKPVFKKSEIVVKDPTDQGESFGISKEVITKVLYKGKEADNYEVGDDILFHLDKVAAKKISKDVFGEALLVIENQNYVICQVCNP